MQKTQTDVIKVSVIVITHNHENFISKTLDSILSQQTNFSFEIIVHDDASTDQTQEILKDYAERYNEKFKLFLSKTNEGPFESAKSAFQKTSGYYLTWLDGDDYWIYDQKLQKQVDFLDLNPSYSGCFHDAEIRSFISETEKLNESNAFHDKWKMYSQFNFYKPDFYPWDLLYRNIIPTATLVFRKANLSPDFFINNTSLKLSINWFLQLQIIRDSKFRYFNEVWSVYVDHPLGISKIENQISFKKSNISYLKKLTEDTYYSTMRKDIYASLCKEYLQLLHIQKKEKDIKLSSLMSYILYSFKRIVAESFYLLRDS
ncbi:MAG: glycosyltransferase [Bacteroidales bacterium]|nr:glycosyltransferase [Bacteroidales bacterium]